MLVLKILGLAMPMHISADFQQLIFQQWGPMPSKGPLKPPMGHVLYNCIFGTLS